MHEPIFLARLLRTLEDEDEDEEAALLGRGFRNESREIMALLQRWVGWLRGGWDWWVERVSRQSEQRGAVWDDIGLVMER